MTRARQVRRRKRREWVQAGKLIVVEEVGGDDVGAAG